MLFLRCGVRTPCATQRAPFKKHRGTNPRAVMGTVALNVQEKALHNILKKQALPLSAEPDLLQRVYGAVNNVFLYLSAQFYKICAVSGNTHQQG